jgi:7-cyano-7-deazaguanine synthase
VERGYEVWALTVHYGQRHARELLSARALARGAGARHLELRLGLPWLKTSSLVDRRKRLPELPLSRIGKEGVPSTYVPGRNTIFAALGMSLADAVGAEAVILGANALDCSAYPDCTPGFYAALQRVARQGTRRKGLRILTPLMRMDKAAIVREALRLKVPLDRTWSCYRGGRRPCGRCDSCKLRANGFALAGARDPV